jgi:hypothetical protein
MFLLKTHIQPYSCYIDLSLWIKGEGAIYSFYSTNILSDTFTKSLEKMSVLEENQISAVTRYISSGLIMPASTFIAAFSRRVLKPFERVLVISTLNPMKTG